MNYTFKIRNALFHTRRTSRISFSSQPVPNEAVAALSKLAREWGQTYEQVTAPEIIEQILERNIEAVFEDLNVRAYHDEIVEWFRFTGRSARQTRDGLDYRCMNSSRLSFWLVARAPQLLQLPVTGALLKKIINADLNLARQINSFQISSYEDKAINRHLKIRLETVKNLLSPLASTEQLHQTMFEGLCRVNQDFREVTKMFDRSCVELEIYEFETGPFRGRDIRVKNKYVVQ